MDSWKPHGLIQKPGLEEPYQNARLSIDIYGNEIDPKEHFTVHLFEDLFNKEIFTGDMFFVNSQQPPSRKRGRDKACDIAIKYLDQNYHHQILCFAEAKRARNMIYSKIRDLEKQAQGYCQDFLEANQKEEFVYACTLVGASIRCWIMRQGDPNLVGFWDGQQRDDFQYYRDVGLDEHKVELVRAFDLMKSVSPSALRLGQDSSMIGSRLGALSISQSAYPSGSTQSLSIGYNDPGPSTAPIVYSPAVQDTFQDPPQRISSSAITPASSLPSTAALNSSDCVYVEPMSTSERDGYTYYRCAQPLGKDIEVRRDRWYESVIDYQGVDIGCWAYTGNSGKIYYAWNLDVKGKGKGSKRK